MTEIRSGVAAEILAEAMKLLPPCCRDFDCIHFYMERVGKPVKVEPWKAPKRD